MHVSRPQDDVRWLLAERSLYRALARATFDSRTSRAEDEGIIARVLEAFLARKAPFTIH